MLKVEDKLVARNPCKMDDTKNNTLTVGVSYEIIRISQDKFTIIDDESDEHFFQIKDYDNFFESIKSFRRKKLNQIFKIKINERNT